MIVGTSTNCSTINGSDRAAREGQDDDEEIMGTSITCSATGRSKRRKKSIALSTICGTGASRICTYGKSSINWLVCRATLTCQPATSDRGAGRPKTGRGVVRNFAVWCNSCSSPCTVLVPCFCPRRAACVVPTLPKEWWVTVARTIWTAICSWRQKLLSRRSRRRRAEPPALWARSTCDMANRPLGFHKKVNTQRSALELETLLVQVVVPSLPRTLLVLRATLTAWLKRSARP